MSEKQLRKPRDGAISPRFCQIATFMRTPAMDDLNEVDVGLVGVPVDHSAMYRPGARHAPAAIRESSRQIRLCNDGTGVRPFDLVQVADIGDVDIHPLDYLKTIAMVEDYFRVLREHDVTPVAIGGDHSITLPILRGLRGDTPFGLVHIDSHPDTFEEHMGSKVNHATPFRRALEEHLIEPSRVVQIGLRGTRYSADEDDYARNAGFRVITFNEYEDLGRAKVIEEVRRVVGDGPTYITVDIDGIDASQAPGTGFPEVGGLSVRDVQVILRSLTGRDIIGADICEVSPPLDVANMTSLVAANLMFELVCLVAVARAGRD
jgi:guanidinopropionase